MKTNYHQSIWNTLSLECLPKNQDRPKVKMSRVKRYMKLVKYWRWSK